MKYNNLKGSLILLPATVIWGLAFVAQSGAAELIPSFCFNALRSFIGAGALYIFYLFVNRKEKATFFPKEKTEKSKYLAAALICGICLAFSVNFQQFGIAFYPGGAAGEARAGFITSLYVILVPVFSIFIGKRTNLFVYLGVIIALMGVYMLCFSEGIGGLYLGDVLVFLCAITFTFHIMAIDKYVPVTGGIKLSIMQLAVSGAVSAVLSLIFELGSINIGNIIAAAPQLLFVGVMSSGVAYTLQISGQKYAEPAVASIIMSLESIFAALGGWLISGNALAVNELIGCGLVFVAIIVAQLPQFSKKAAV